jgi:(E)-4-hydroxy-3-methylbut-2-enyl-diphosphate synthase
MKSTRRLMVKDVPIGGGAPVSVQTMTRSPTREAARVLQEIDSLLAVTTRSLRERSVALLRELDLLGEFEEISPVRCDLVRCAVPDAESAKALPEIVAHSPIPVIADIHFNHRLALQAVETGVAKIRINPGNLGGREPTQTVAKACRERGVPIRIGVNAGSLENDLQPLFKQKPAQALVHSALRNARMVEDAGVSDIVISLKEHSPRLTIRACRLLSRVADYPQHLGVTEAGVGAAGIIRSLIGIGTLLSQGIGDTIRVSLTEDSDLEVAIGALLARRKKTGRSPALSVGA